MYKSCLGSYQFSKHISMCFKQSFSAEVKNLIAFIKSNKYNMEKNVNATIFDKTN